MDIQRVLLYRPGSFRTWRCRYDKRRFGRVAAGQRTAAFPLLPILLLSKGKRAFKREYLWFYVLVGGWLLGTIIADLYFSSPLTNRLKGTARVVFFALNFMALAI